MAAAVTRPVAVATQALAGAGLFGVSGGGHHIGTRRVIHFVPHTVPAAVPAESVLETDLELTADARLKAALFEVIADPVVSAPLTSVATIRASTPLPGFKAAATIDFGRLVTIGGLVDSSESPDVLTAVSVTGGAVSLGVDAVHRWTGTDWAALATGLEFAETAAERLLVLTSDAGDDSHALAGRLAAFGHVRLPAAPSSLELLVDGRTVWFERQGSSAGDVDDPSAPSTTAGVRYLVDRTDAVREAFDRAAAAAASGDDTLTVRVALRAAAPGALRLTPQLRSLRVDTHIFGPDGLVHTVDLAEEGVVDVDVTPPQALAVHEVALVVRGRFGPERVLPPVGPTPSDAARLVLAVGRSVLVGLPRTLAARFGTLSGVRLLLRAPDGGQGGQVTGRLLAASDRPGDPLDGGDVTPVTVSAPSFAWFTLPFTAPVILPPATPPSGPAPAKGDVEVAAWLELQAGYGEVECALTSASPTHPSAPGAVLRRRLSGGGTGALSEIPALGPLHAALRVVGLPDRDHAVPAAVLAVPGTPDVLDVNPGGDDLDARLTLASPLPVSTGLGGGVTPVLLRATCAATGSLTFDTVRVTYRRAES